MHLRACACPCIWLAGSGADRCRPDIAEAGGEGEGERGTKEKEEEGWRDSTGCACVVCCVGPALPALAPSMIAYVMCVLFVVCVPPAPPVMALGDAGPCAGGLAG